MLKYSANLSLLFTEVPLIERFAAARAAGFSAVEIQFPYELAIADILRELETHELRLVLINVPAGDLMQGGDGLACVPGREQAFRHAVMDALHYASALGVPTVNVLAGREPAGESLTRCLHTLAGSLRYASETLQSIGVTTVVEAINTVDMPRFLVHNVAQMQEMLEIVDHPTLKMQFDCYHMARMGEDVLQALTDNIDSIGHVQFADTPGRHQPGTGALDFAAIFTRLRELPYAGWCGAEYRPHGCTQDSMHWLQQWPQDNDH
ncbi:MAG: TIM barrel protein [Moraxellaceae bacterium]|nr:TIM barrel protein [Moraxellaceae bacterium]